MLIFFSITQNVFPAFFSEQIPPLVKLEKYIFQLRHKIRSVHYSSCFGERSNTQPCLVGGWGVTNSWLVQSFMGWGTLFQDHSVPKMGPLFLPVVVLHAIRTPWTEWQTLVKTLPSRILSTWVRSRYKCLISFQVWIGLWFYRGVEVSTKRIF